MPCKDVRAFLEVNIAVAPTPVISGDDKLINAIIRRDEIGATLSKGPGPGRLKLLSTAVDKPVEFGDVTAATWLIIRAYDPIFYRLGSLTAPRLQLNPIVPNTNGNPLSNEMKEQQPGVIVIAGSNVPELYLTPNNNGNDCCVYVSLLGDAL